MILINELWKSESDKLEKSGRKWKPSLTKMPYRCAELFCEKCGKSMGIRDIVTTNLETLMYCSDCVKEYVRPVPYYLKENLEVTFDNGLTIVLRYHLSELHVQDESKICYFNKKGRYIKIKGKRICLNKSK